MLASCARARPDGPRTKDEASAWDKWAGVVAAALTAATDWAHGLQSSTAPSGADSRATRAAKQQQQRVQLCMQDAAFHLGRAATLLLLPSLSNENRDVPKWHPLPDLLTSLAGFCGVTSDALEALVQVCGLDMA
jgi:hypothetical protein